MLDEDICHDEIVTVLKQQINRNIAGPVLLKCINCIYLNKLADCNLFYLSKLSKLQMLQSLRALNCWLSVFAANTWSATVDDGVDTLEIFLRSRSLTIFSSDHNNARPPTIMCHAVMQWLVLCWSLSSVSAVTMTTRLSRSSSMPQPTSYTQRQHCEMWVLIHWWMRIQLSQAFVRDSHLQTINCCYWWLTLTRVWHKASVKDNDQWPPSMLTWDHVGDTTDTMGHPHRRNSLTDRMRTRYGQLLAAVLFGCIFLLIRAPLS